MINDELMWKQHFIVAEQQRYNNASHFIVCLYMMYTYSSCVKCECTNNWELK